MFFRAVQYVKLTLSSFLFFFFVCPPQKRNGLQMSQKMPTPGTFRSSPWALTWPTKSTNTNLPVVWFHPSEKLKTNAERRVFLADSPDTRRLFRQETGEGGGGSPVKEWRWQWCWRPTHFPSLILLISGRTGTPKKLEGTPMCIPLMLLPCSWTLFNLLMYP